MSDNHAKKGSSIEWFCLASKEVCDTIFQRHDQVCRVFKNDLKPWMLYCGPRPLLKSLRWSIGFQISLLGPSLRGIVELVPGAGFALLLCLCLSIFLFLSLSLSLLPQTSSSCLSFYSSSLLYLSFCLLYTRGWRASSSAGCGARGQQHRHRQWSGVPDFGTR